MQSFFFFAVTIDADGTGFEECSSAAMPTDTHAAAADTMPDAAALQLLDSCEHANTLLPARRFSQAHKHV